MAPLLPLALKVENPEVEHDTLPDFACDNGQDWRTTTETGHTTKYHEGDKMRTKMTEPGD